jgi:hypothetical protein
VLSPAAVISNVRSTVPPGDVSPEKLLLKDALWPDPTVNVADVGAPDNVAPLIVPVGSSLENVSAPAGYPDGMVISKLNVHDADAARLPPVNRIDSAPVEGNILLTDDPGPHGVAGNVIVVELGSGGETGIVNSPFVSAFAAKFVNVIVPVVALPAAVSVNDIVIDGAASCKIWIVEYARLLVTVAPDTSPVAGPVEPA